MTHEVAPAVFAIHEVAKGATQLRTQLSDRVCNPPLIEGVRVRSDHAKGIANHGVK